MNFIADRFSSLANAPVLIVNKQGLEISRCIPKESEFPVLSDEDLKQRILSLVKTEKTVVNPDKLLPYTAFTLSDGNILISGPFKDRKAMFNVNNLVDVFCYFIRRLNPDLRDSANEQDIKDCLEQCMSDFDYRAFEKILPTESPHNTYAHELAHMEAISKGDPELALRCKMMPVHGKLGTLGPNNKRHLRNHCIVGATLCARAAIKGGVSVETAFTLADYFINKVELVDDEKMLEQYTYKIVVVFANIVKKLKERNVKQPRQQVVKIIDVIKRSLYKDISRDELIADSNLSADYIERIFKADTGMTIMEYLAYSRVQVACELLKDTQTSISEIGAILCFSTQSYFGRVFKKFTGTTPAQYRKKNFSRIINEMD